MKKKIGIFLIVIAFICLIIGLIQINTGFNKKNQYYNSDTLPSSNKNVYVGGDAYNYIINGTYFTGYVVLGSTLLLIGTITMVYGLFLILNEQTQNISINEEKKETFNQLPPL